MLPSISTSFRRKKRSEQGYILLTLLLFVALLGFSFAILMAESPIAFQIKRDREEEMVHRGVQYSRAIRKYVKKNGRFPSRLEDLENTNNIRYLRKRYKDPITGKDFKLLRQGDPQLAGLTAIAGLGGQNASLAAAAANLKTAGNNSSVAGALAAAAGQNGVPTQGIQNLNGDDPSVTDPAQTAAGAAGPDKGVGAQAAASKAEGATDSPLGAGFSNLGNGQSFGGGSILGVESTSKDATIREYNKKKHYNEWWFIYDATSDRGTGQITGPYQTPLQSVNLNGQGNQQNPNGIGNQSSPFGNQNSPFGAAPNQQNPQSQQPGAPQN